MRKTDVILFYKPIYIKFICPYCKEENNIIVKCSDLDKTIECISCNKDIKVDKITNRNIM